MKRSIGILILLCAMAMQVFAIGGKCGDKVKWNFDKSTGVLTISGEGPMKDCWGETPWKKYNDLIGEIKINEGVTDIGVNAFNKCRYANSVSIPGSVKQIKSNAFSECHQLKVVDIPNGVVRIDRWAFHNCSRLESVVIPNSVISIKDFAFANCISLKKIILPNSVQNLGQGVFAGCIKLSSVTLSNQISSIPEQLFKTCSQLNSIIIPNSVTSIGPWAFEGCSSLTSVTIPNSVKSIGHTAFRNCTKLKSITIPSSVVGELEFEIFQGCTNLQSVSLPNTISSISVSAFENCASLTNITLPSSLKKISMKAFKGCTKLTSITIPNAVTSIYDNPFEGCTSLKEIHYPKDLDLSNVVVPSAKKIAYDRTNPPRPKEVHPPLLAMVDGSLTFTDESGNSRIDAGEKSTVRFQVKNNGKGDAYDCEARIRLSGDSKGIYASSVKLPVIPTGQTATVSIPITSDLYTVNGAVQLTISIYEPNGFGVAPFDLTVATKAYDEPLLQVVDYNIASASGKVKQMEPFVLRFNLQNTKYGTAEDVRIRLNLPTGVFVMDDAKERTFKQVKSGEAILVQYNLIANNNYSDTNIPITIDVKEKHGRFAENKRLDIALNQTTSSSINIAAKDEPQEERKEIQKAMLTSEVDRNIPVTGAKNPNTFVLIIANEHYLQVAGVPYALNDGNIFREYCIKTLGISEKHIKYFADATGNQIKSGVNWLANLTEVFDNPQIIVYYAGHGVPDEASKSAYLLPVDGNGSDISTGYKLDELYATLGNMPAAQITVFMDACFSGSKRQQGMLASARGVALKVKAGTPQGNMVVFSAATGDETAYPNNEQQHGLFTYYLLKKLQETKGNVALKDLGEYITKQVSQQSLIINDRRQTPTVTPSAAVGAEWQNWKLK